MYDKSDPRSSLSSAASKKEPVFTSYAPSSYARFYELEPAEVSDDARIWYARGRNAVLSYADAKSGARFERKGQIDEWALILPDKETSVTVVAEGQRSSISGNSLTFVPPGDSTIIFETAGRMVRLFTAQSKDLVNACSNASDYVEPDRNIPPLQAWPAPPDGFKIRNHSLDVADEPGRFGRIWRCTTFMINNMPSFGPRDVKKLSPHHHDDFEQYSLAVQGSFMHYIRWPWTPNMKMWRGDEAEFCGTPSVAMIPPPAIHTTRALDSSLNQLVDIFCPPRLDFSLKKGWVLNASDYPLPAGADAA
jgi:hypothetical protein